MLFGETLIKLILSIVNLAAIVILTFSIFRIPIREYHKQITLLALILGTSNFYFKFILESSLNFPILLITYLILLMLFRGYPILYALITCFTGMLAASIVDLVISYGALTSGLSTIDQMEHELSHYLVMNLMSAALCILASFFLVKLRLGFNFVVMRYSGKKSLRSYNFIWAIILVTGAFIAQLSVMNKEIFSIYGYIFAGLFVLFISNITYAFFQNKKSLKDRERIERIDKH